MDFSEFCRCPETNMSQYFIIPLSVFLGFVFVSYFVVDRKSRSQDTDEVEEKEEEEDEYEIKYPYKSAVHMDQDLNKLKYSMTVDYTPRGVVIMLWNQEDNAFLYWADNDIPYTYLQTVSRKYVTLYNCRDVYIKSETYDKAQETNKQTNEDEQTNEQTNDEQTNKQTNDEQTNKQTNDEEETKEEEKKSVFVQMKKYNIKPKVSDDDEKTNKFIKKGKLQDYKPFPLEDEGDRDIEFVSYSQFAKNAKDL